MPGAALELVQEAILHRDAETDRAHLQPGWQGGLVFRQRLPAVLARRAWLDGGLPFWSIGIDRRIFLSQGGAWPADDRQARPARRHRAPRRPADLTGSSSGDRTDAPPALSRMVRPFRTSSDILDLLAYLLLPRGRTHSGHDRGLGSWEDKAVVGIPADAQRVPVAGGAVTEQAFVLLHLHQRPGW